jgi:hypothetical protein
MLPLLPREMLTGRLCRVEPLYIVKHADDRHVSCRAEITGADWNYLPYGPFRTIGEFESGLATQTRGYGTHVSDDGSRFWNRVLALLAKM